MARRITLLALLAPLALTLAPGLAAAEDAVIAGALATTVEGAQPSQPTRAQIDAVKAGT